MGGRKKNTPAIHMPSTHPISGKIPLELLNYLRRESQLKGDEEGSCEGGAPGMVPGAAVGGAVGTLPAGKPLVGTSAGAVRRENRDEGREGVRLVGSFRAMLELEVVEPFEAVGR